MSVIMEQDFLSQLYIIQSQNPPSYVLFSNVKTFYDIDLSTRTINAPKILSVSKDHKSETIYFRVDRYHDYMDLSNTTCVIQYITPDKKTHLYAVPFYDILTDKKNNKMIFPWNIDGVATKFSGPVTFSIRFFIADREVVVVDDYVDEEDITTPPTEVRYNLIYNLSTTLAESEVLDGMEVDELYSDFDTSSNTIEYLLQLVNDVNRQGVYWTILDD